MKVAYAMKDSSKYQSPCKVVHLCGITTIFSTLGIPVSKRQWKLQYNGKVWETPSNPKQSHARLAKWIKKRTQKYGHLPPKIVISTPWEALCVYLISLYTLKGKDGLSIDFMAFTMIDPTSSWFEVVKLPTIMQLMTKKVNSKERTIEEEIYNLLQ